MFFAYSSILERILSRKECSDVNGFAYVSLVLEMTDTEASNRCSHDNSRGELSRSELETVSGHPNAPRVNSTRTSAQA